MGRSLLFIVFLLAGCPGGGDDGGAGNTPITPTASPTQTIVSGTVQAPAGQILSQSGKDGRAIRKTIAWSAVVP
jgi:hypothetical protein